MSPELKAEKAGSVYFKSTDGHVGEWGFSLRRVNGHLLGVLGGGVGRGDGKGEGEAERDWDRDRSDG